MTLQEWIADSKLRLDAFAAEFAKKQADDPMNYPRGMPPGEWDEQFRAYDETRGPEL